MSYNPLNDSIIRLPQFWQIQHHDNDHWSTFP